jgi:hypothetical protein
MSFPKLAHFIWYGASFPWMNVLALRSAHDRGGFERVVLHFDSQLSAASREALRDAMPRLELRPIDGEKVFGAIGDAAIGARLVSLHAELQKPAARANVLRAALLAAEGGVYLDIDTVTVRALDPLMHGAFCGTEPIAFPARVMQSRSPAVWARALALHAARYALRQAPSGYRAFKRIEPLYARAANNAVLGAPPGHRFMHALLEAMVDLPAERRHVRFALGTHLLQQTIARYPHGDLTVHEPVAFYPLGPEISRHWFRIAPQGKTVKLSDVIDARTFVVHWYASVRNRALVDQMSPARVRELAQRQLLSALALPFCEHASVGTNERE